LGGLTPNSPALLNLLYCKLSSLQLDDTSAQKGKEQEILEDRKSQAKTDVVVPVIGIKPVAIRRATIPQVVEPRTTTQYPKRRC
jgi:hypothetical protein